MSGWISGGSGDYTDLYALETENWSNLNNKENAEIGKKFKMLKKKLWNKKVNVWGDLILISTMATIEFKGLEHDVPIPYVPLCSNHGI